MKYSKLIISLAVLFASINAHAITIIDPSGTYNGLGVGGIDTFKAFTTTLHDSSPEAEKAWAEGILGGSITLTLEGEYKEEDVSIYETIDAAENVYAFQLISPFDYYIVKNSTVWALYQNVADFHWAVFEAVEGLNVNDATTTISHYTGFGTPPSETPGPDVPDSGATIALMGIALAGLGFLKRRR